MQSNSELQRPEEGKQREEVLYSFKKIGLVEIIFCGCLFCIGILTTIVGTLYPRWWHVFTRISSGVWCSLLSLPAGIMSLITANKVSYFNIGWTFIFSVIGAFFLLVHLCISLASALETIYQYPDPVGGLQIVLFICGLANIILCLYNAIVFGRLFTQYPHRVVGGNGLCPCCNYSHYEGNSFAHVMCSNLASKKHDH